MRIAATMTLVLAGCGDPADEVFVDWDFHERKGAQVDMRDAETIIAVHGAVAGQQLGRSVLSEYLDGGPDVYFVGGPLWQDALGIYWIKGAEIRVDLFKCLAHSALAHELTHHIQPGIDAEHQEAPYWNLGGIANMAQLVTTAMLCADSDALAVPYDPNAEGCVIGHPGGD